MLFDRMSAFDLANCSRSSYSFSFPYDFPHKTVDVCFKYVKRIEVANQKFTLIVL
jgi:hypothetical protein